MDPVEATPALPTSIERGPHTSFLGALLDALTRTLIRHATRINQALPKEGSEAMTAPLLLATYTTATRPAAGAWAGGTIYVSDAAAGSKFQGSDGTSWVSLG